MPRATGTGTGHKPTAWPGSKCQVSLATRRSGQWISSVSAILFFVLMFFHWFGVKLVNNSKLLFAIQSVEPGKSAWEALEYIPIVLTITIIVTLAVAGLRLVNTFPKPSLPVNSLVRSSASSRCC